MSVHDSDSETVFINHLGVPNPFGPVLTRTWLTDLERSTNFWDRKSQLQYIAWRAYQEKVSPWGLLMAVMLHRLAHVPPTVMLVNRAGNETESYQGGTSLNMFGCLTADSGGGKSATFKLASEIMPPPMTPVSDGTGQGLVKSIAETEKVTSEDGQKLAEPYYITRFHRHSLVVHAPEIGTVNAEFAREGSKTASMMRSLWSGETVGMTTGDRDRRVTLPANTYRIVELIGAQFHNTGAILDQAGDGTPQRFLWTPAEEYRRTGITRIDPTNGGSVKVTFPFPTFGQVGSNTFGVSGGELPTEYRDGDPLPAPIWVHWSPLMRQDITAFQAQREALRDRDPHADLTPEQIAAELAATMESHFILTRIKVAAMMGFLWGHAEPDDEDWRLSDVLTQVVRRELAGAWKQSMRYRAGEIDENGRTRGLEMHAADLVRDLLREEDFYSICNRVWKWVCSEGPKSNADIRRFVKGGEKKKKAIPVVLNHLLDEGKLIQDINNMYWGVYKDEKTSRTCILPMERSAQFIAKP